MDDASTQQTCVKLPLCARLGCAQWGRRGRAVTSKETQVWETDLARVISGAGQCWGGGNTQSGVTESIWVVVSASQGRGHSNRDLHDDRVSLQKELETSASIRNRPGTSEGGAGTGHR